MLLKRTVQDLGFVNNLSCEVGPLLILSLLCLAEFFQSFFIVPLSLVRDGKEAENNSWSPDDALPSLLVSVGPLSTSQRNQRSTCECKIIIKT